jgi:hypothetical protein
MMDPPDERTCDVCGAPVADVVKDMGGPPVCDKHLAAWRSSRERDDAAAAALVERRAIGIAPFKEWAKKVKAHLAERAAHTGPLTEGVLRECLDEIMPRFALAARLLEQHIGALGARIAEFERRLGSVEQERDSWRRAAEEGIRDREAVMRTQGERLASLAAERDEARAQALEEAAEDKAPRAGAKS